MRYSSRLPFSEAQLLQIRRAEANANPKARTWKSHSSLESAHAPLSGKGSQAFGLEIGRCGNHKRVVVNPLRGVRVERHRLILVTQLEDRVFNWTIVQTKRNLLEIAKPARCVVLVGVDPVVSDHSREE